VNLVNYEGLVESDFHSTDEDEKYIFNIHKEKKISKESDIQECLESEGNMEEIIKIKH
jgi:hypothetical protein